MLIELLAAAGLVGSAGLALRAAWFEPRSLRLSEHHIASPGWPASWAPLRIGLLADPHVGSLHDTISRLERAVAMLQTASPDLILCLGDYIERRWSGPALADPAEVAGALGQLRAPLGVYAVLGNHDWRLHGVPMRAALEAVGVPVLTNRSQRLDSADGPFWLIGVGDRYVGLDDLDSTLAAVEDGPIVLMTHSPDLFPDVPAQVALTVAGHTHGGQIHLPLIGAPWVPSRHGRQYLRGHVVEDDRHLFISRGLGNSRVPIRFGAPPEVVVVTLQGEQR
jgi:predicted MPP superfamily phosphohydrolase